MTDKEIRKQYEALTGLDDAGVAAFEDKVNSTIQSTIEYVDNTKDANSVHVYEFVRDNYEGAELILFASQMLSELIQFILNDRNSPPSMAEVMAMILSDKLGECGPDCDCDCEDKDTTEHVAVKGDA